MADANSLRRKAATILVAGGSGSRAGLAQPKQYVPYRGSTVLGFALRKLREAVDGPIVVVIPAGDEDRARAAVGEDAELFFTQGGRTRQESVQAGLECLGKLDCKTSHVLVHDAARPDLPPEVVARLLDRLKDAEGAIPVLPITDSIVTSGDSVMRGTADRDTLWRVQTPQAFVTASLIRAQSEWNGPLTAGDDAQVLFAAGMEVALVEGDEALHKLTLPEDFESRPAPIRIGTGYDVHRFAQDGELWLCGIRIEHERGLAGHSDADVAIHALVDAMLGALGEGDIGEHFPPSDPQWKGAASDRFLSHAAQIASDRGYHVGNADVTIICEAPRVGPYRDEMRAKLAEILYVDIGTVSVKATTTEKLGFVGRGEGIAAQAVVSLIRS